VITQWCIECTPSWVNQTFGRLLIKVDHTKVYWVYTFRRNTRPFTWNKFCHFFNLFICGCITLISSQRLCEHYYFAWTNKLTTFLFENMHYISVEYILIDDLLTLKWLHASLNIIRRKHIHISTFLRETIQVTQLITKQIHF
jgi:glycosyltransferase involved in cell wall biosynthesis